jgi:aminotransferase
MTQDPKRHIARHVVDLPKSGIRDFFAVVEKMPEAISLGIGEPDFVTPWRIREAAIFALERGKTSYTNNLGLIKLRQALSRYVRRKFELEYNPENEILVAVGVSEALDLAMRALLNPGDKVLYHQPCYVSYQPTAILCHAEPVPVATLPQNEFSLDPAALRAAWQPGCKMLLLNFPTNPTGGVVEHTRLEAIAAFAREKDLIVVTDEVYAELTFEGKHVSLASLPGMKERTVFLHGVSKAFAMTGFRIGYACAPAPIIEAMMKVHQYSMMCAPILSQEASIEAFTNGDDEVKRMKDAYQQRRDFVVRRFNEIGLPCHLPQATFYAFPRVDTTGLDERSFALTLLEKAKVAMVPGTAFGTAGRGFCRASFSTGYERLLEATERIDKFVNSLKPNDALLSAGKGV